MNRRRKFFVVLALSANFAGHLSAQKLLPVSVAVSTNYQLNGVAVSHDDRIFVALPRWVQPNSFSLGEVKDGRVVPYPGGDWNKWHQGMDEETRFTAVNAVWIEPGMADALWVVDCGQGIPNGKKLVKIDLKTNTVSRVYHFSQEDAPLAACLNDVRIAKGHAFLTESGLGAILTLDLKTGRIRRLLAASTKTKAVPGRSAVVDGRRSLGPDGNPPVVNADDIEISPDKNWLYFGMPMGGDLWKVKIDDLLDESLDEKALEARVLDDGPIIPIGGMYMLPNGTLLLSDLEKHALQLRTPDGKLTLLAQSKWLDSPDAMSLDKEGRIYIAASQAGRSPGGNQGVNETKRPFRVLRVTLPRNLLRGQAPPAGAKPSLLAAQDPREPAVLAQCKNPPLPAPEYGDAPLGLRDYKVTEIPGVISAGQKWKSLWQQMGDNGDGIVGSPDGGLLIAQNDSSDVLKLDKQGNASVSYTDTNTGGSLSMNSKGELFIVDRGFHPSLSELAPNRKTLADHYKGDPLDCSGVVLNDLTADSKGGAYFTMGGVFYASPSGEISRYDGKNLKGPNGIILSANEQTLYVSNGITLVAFDVQRDGSLTNQRDFGKLEAGGFGDGSAIDAQGRVYVTTAPGVQVIAPDGKYLGLIPTPRPVISVAFSGPDKKTLYVLAQGAKDAQGKEVDNAAQVYSIPMIAQGFKKRAK